MLKPSKDANKTMRSTQNIFKDSKRDKQVDHHKATLTLDSDEQKQTLRKTQKTKNCHRHDVAYKMKLQNSKTLAKQKLQNATAARSTKTIQKHNKNRNRHKMHKTRQVWTRPNKTNDMSNKLLVSTYIKTINGETNQHPNEKHTAETYSINIILEVKCKHTDINTYSLNQLEDDKNIYKPIHDSKKQIITNRLTDINQTPEKLKQTTVEKGLHKGKYRLVTTQQQRFKGRKTQDKKMNKQKIELNYNKNHYSKQQKQYKNKEYCY